MYSINTFCSKNISGADKVHDWFCIASYWRFPDIKKHDVYWLANASKLNTFANRWEFKYSPSKSIDDIGEEENIA